jgi:hypothetical protein
MANSTTLFKLPDGRMAVDVTENKTLAIKDCGVVQNVITDALTITLPATTIGYRYTVRNGGAHASGAPERSSGDESVLITISPNSNDMIAGMEVTAANDKDFTNTKATAKVGDEISLIGDAAAGNGWNVVEVKGIWAKEA